MNNSRLIILGIVALAIVGSIMYLESTKLKMGGPGADVAVEPTTMSQDQKSKKYPLAKELVNPSGFINSQPFQLQDLIGKKVILVDFWTYSCINCQRTTPYLTSWYEKYKDQGLEIVGVHTPEFEFEKIYDNVVAATKQYGITYPVVQDNDYGTWRNYGNRYWPRKYLIDIDGYIVYDHIGEGGYAETETKIQELLAERKQALGEAIEIAGDMVSPEGVEDVDATKPRSPEIYFGSSRNLYLGNGDSNQAGVQDFTEPTGIKTDILYLSGSWNIQPEYAESNGAGAKVIFRYQAQKVFFVAASAQPTNVKILIDGKPVTDIAGNDVVNGEATIQEDRLYRLIEDSAWGEHTIEIISATPGLQVYTFTFG